MGTSQYGASDGWGVLRSESGRAHDFICGYKVSDDYPGLAYCAGESNKTGWGFTNHQVSISFDRTAKFYEGSTIIGCDGKGEAYGKTAQWEAEMWIRY